MFNIQRFLEEKGGRLLGSDSIAMPCPKCGISQHHQSHFHVSLSKPVFNCLRCGYHGNWTKLVADLQRIPYEVAKSMVEGSVWIPSKKKEEEEIIPVSLPVRSRWTNEAWNYITSRIRRETIDNFGIYYCAIGRYAERVIVPITFKKEVVSFQARTAVGHPVRYLTPSKSPLGKVLFGYDEVFSKKVILVEGVFDVFNLWENGFNSMATFGHKISSYQIQALKEKGINEIILMYDSDSIEIMKNMFVDLERHFDSVSIAPLTEGDPADCKNFNEPFSNILSSMEEIRAWQMREFKRKRKLDNLSISC